MLYTEEDRVIVYWEQIYLFRELFLVIGVILLSNPFPVNADLGVLFLRITIEAWEAWGK